jgi:hypothetical protein
MIRYNLEAGNGAVGGRGGVTTSDAGAVRLSGVPNYDTWGRRSKETLREGGTAMTAMLRRRLRGVLSTRKRERRS